MNLDRVTSGRNVPNDLNVIIEIPAHSDPVKYELDKKTGAMFVDRFMNTAMNYPCNYGYVPHTLSKDGDPVDVMVITTYPLIPGSVIKCRPVGVLKMTDESGDDAKVLEVPTDKGSRRRLGRRGSGQAGDPGEQKDVRRCPGETGVLTRI